MVFRMSWSSCIRNAPMARSVNDDKVTMGEQADESKREKKNANKIGQSRKQRSESAIVSARR